MIHLRMLSCEPNNQLNVLCSETEGDVGAVNHVQVPPVIHYLPFQGGSSVVVLCACFWCQSFDDVSPYVCLYYFSSVWVADMSGNLLGKSCSLG